MEEQNNTKSIQCQNCGKFVSQDDGYYAKESESDDDSLVVLFCNEKCIKSYYTIIKPKGN